MIEKNDILTAHALIKNYIHKTPVLTCRSLDHIFGTKIFFKCENFQKVGAFKIRGATNAIFSLSTQEMKHGVATHSSGNHAAALTLAAKWRKIPARVVMPKTSPKVKVNAVKNYGADITFCEPNQLARETALNKIVEDTGAKFIHPYNNEKIITGQSTAALEILQEYNDLDFLIAPVGGGGLISGTALTCHHFFPKTKVVGAEPKGADDAYRSMLENRIVPSEHPQTIADGLLTSLGSLTFPIIKDKVERIFTAKEALIIQAMRYIWERMKIVIEPSSAVPLAVIMENQKYFQDKRVGIIISGGNVELGNLPFEPSK
ncbi:MAG: pyridoxal-phosphate dependent enzyme [Fidelibacterota bacterium]